LSEDDGPPATEFLEDGFEDDRAEDEDDDEPLAQRAERVKQSNVPDAGASVGTDPSRA
jgi:hypothetical protein